MTRSLLFLRLGLGLAIAVLLALPQDALAQTAFSFGGDVLQPTSSTSMATDEAQLPVTFDASQGELTVTWYDVDLSRIAYTDGGLFSNCSPTSRGQYLQSVLSDQTGTKDEIRLALLSAFPCDGDATSAFYDNLFTGPYNHDDSFRHYLAQGSFVLDGSADDAFTSHDFGPQASAYHPSVARGPAPGSIAEGAPRAYETFDVRLQLVNTGSDRYDATYFVRLHAASSWDEGVRLGNHGFTAPYVNGAAINTAAPGTEDDVFDGTFVANGGGASFTNGAWIELNPATKAIEGVFDQVAVTLVNTNGFAVTAAGPKQVPFTRVTVTGYANRAPHTYVHPGWAVLSPGLDPDGTGPAIAIGYDAFATVADAVSATRTGGTVHLSGHTFFVNDLTLTRSIKIVGEGARTTILKAAHLPGIATTRLFNVPSAVSVTLEALTLSNGNGVTNGGAVSNEGSLTLNRVSVRDNAATDHGGALYSTGPLYLNRTTFRDNEAGSDGGAIALSGGGLGQFDNSTFSGNRAARGGAIYHGGSGALRIDYSTVADNSATTEAGGLAAGGAGSFRLLGVLASGNTAPIGPNGSGAFITLGSNLISDGTGLTGPVNDVLNDRVGTTAAPLDAGLRALADNGGQTDTHALSTTSPAVDAGNCAVSEDQRGEPRPTDGDGNGEGYCDIGAYEAGEPLLATLVNLTMAVGGEANFDLTILDDLTGLGAISFQFVLTYDPAVATFVGVTTDGTLAAGRLVSTGEPTPGTVNVLVAGDAAFSGSGNLLGLQFTAADAPGTTSLVINDFFFNEGSPSALGGTGSLTVYVPPGDIPPDGEVNGNGEITAADAVRVLLHLSGEAPLTGNGLVAAEVSGDGRITAYDASLILQYAVGLIDCFPVEAACTPSAPPAK